MLTLFSFSSSHGYAYECSAKASILGELYADIRSIFSDYSDSDVPKTSSHRQLQSSTFPLTQLSTPIFPHIYQDIFL